MDPGVQLPAYLNDTYLFRLPVRVVAKAEDGSYEFSDSIYHLQGGGQPNDKGWIRKADELYPI